jgi:hypothetical protein
LLIKLAQSCLATSEVMISSSQTAKIAESPQSNSQANRESEDAEAEDLESSKARI